MKTSELITEIIREVNTGVALTNNVISQAISIQIDVDGDGEPTNKNKVATVHLAVFPRPPAPTASHHST